MVRYVREYNRAALEVIDAAPRATVVARWMRDYIEERTSASPAVTPPGIDLAEFERAGPAEFLQHSGLAPGFILWVGRLALEKGLEGFVRLAERMRTRAFVIVTDRPEGEARSQGLPRLPPNIHYFSQLPRALVVSAFQGCSIYVSTSLYDAAPTTFLEAMACEKTVVGPNLFGPREIVQDSGGGLLYDPPSHDDLERQVLAALDHPELGRRGYAFVHEHRDWKKLARFFDRQYEELASRD
jgi:glycosyltransferase involved in cell wall biosynthesis